MYGAVVGITVEVFHMLLVFLTNMSDFTIETKNGKQYSANVDELQAAVASWLSDTGYADAPCCGAFGRVPLR